MRLDALTSAAPIIQAHAYAAMTAIVIGAIQFALPKGTRSHQATGLTWAAVMMIVAGSSLFIHVSHTFGPFSWIHLLSIFTIVMVPFGVIAARRGGVTTHAWTMALIYVLALIVTGLFTLWPGRIMHKVVFGG